MQGLTRPLLREDHHHEDHETKLKLEMTHKKTLKTGWTITKICLPHQCHSALHCIHGTKAIHSVIEDVHYLNFGENIWSIQFSMSMNKHDRIQHLCGNRHLIWDPGGGST